MCHCPGLSSTHSLQAAVWEGTFGVNYLSAVLEGKLNVYTSHSQEHLSGRLAL